MLHLLKLQKSPNKNNSSQTKKVESTLTITKFTMPLMGNQTVEVEVTRRSVVEEGKKPI